MLLSLDDIQKGIVQYGTRLAAESVGPFVLNQSGKVYCLGPEHYSQFESWPGPRLVHVPSTSVKTYDVGIEAFIRATGSLTDTLGFVPLGPEPAEILYKLGSKLGFNKITPGISLSPEGISFSLYQKG